MDGIDLPALLEQLTEQRKVVKAADEKLSAEREELEAIQSLIIEKMEASGFQSVKAGGVNYAAKTTMYAQITDKEALLEWLENSPESDEDLLTFKPSSARLNEIVRARLDNQEEMPPGLTFRPKQYISITSE